MDDEIVVREDEIPAIFDDNLVQMAERAEKRIESVKKIKIMSLAVTNEADWIDQNGKPFLQTSGAEKVARLFGISWRIDEPKLSDEDEGHYSYTYKGYFTLGNATIEAIGTRSSRDKFFNKYEYEEGKERKLLSPLMIDKGDVQKSAFTNCIGNGVTRLLGIRNLTYQDLQTGGIDISKIGKVEYKRPEMSDESKLMKAECHKMLTSLYGNNYAEQLEEITAFTAADGKVVQGKKTLDGLSEKAIKVTYGKIKTIYTKNSQNPPPEKERDASLITHSDHSQNDKNNVPPSPPPSLAKVKAQEIIEKMEMAQTYQELVKIRSSLSADDFMRFSKQEQEKIMTVFTKQEKKIRGEKK